MAKTNQIKKMVNGEIADGDDVNQAVEDAGTEGGAIPYDPTDHQREGDGSEHLGSLTYPWGDYYVNEDAKFVEVDPGVGMTFEVLWKNLRRFIFLKDAPASYAGHGTKNVKVKADETGLEFSQGESIPANIQVFTSSGTWTKPSGVTRVHVKVWGGGGNGQQGPNGGCGAGGGGGGYAEGIIVVSGNVTVTVGAGGGTSSFAGDTTIQATGGANGSAVTSGIGGVGGVGSVGTINLSGANGGDADPAGGSAGGGGGGSPLGGGGGGGGGGALIDGGPGCIPGGGGGGGFDDGVGGVGAPGMVIVYY